MKSDHGNKQSLKGNQNARKDDKKDKVVTVRLTKAEKEELEQRAKNKGMKVSEYIKTLIDFQNKPE